MNITLFEILFDLWKDKEINFQRKGRRRYLHFDNHIPFHTNIQFFKDFLKRAEINVPRHSFYPLIKSNIISPRLRIEKDENGKKKLVRKVKIRPISYAAHFDSLLYSWYSNILSEFYQDNLKNWGIEESVLAYIPKNASNIEFAHEIFEYIKAKGPCVSLAFDISSFFDGLDHNVLKKMWCKVLNTDELPNDHYAVYKSLTCYTYVEKEIVDRIFSELSGTGEYIDGRYCTPNEFREFIRNGGFVEKNPFKNQLNNSTKFGEPCGIPQGSPISACLSNIYMIEFDQLINIQVKIKGGIYRRYCDDIIIVCNSENSQEMKNLVVSTIMKFELCINENKTDTTYFLLDKLDNKLKGYNSGGVQKKLQYLGFEFDGINTYIRSSSMSRYARKLNEATQKAVDHAYSQKYGQNSRIFRKKIYRRFAENGNRNFISYAERASKEIMKSHTIHKQYKNSSIKIEKAIKRKIENKEKKLVKKQIAFVSKK